uniref:Multiple epidermal growth factor-like domains protein 10 isoform X1 n=1 Tax=Crassostrea virginica TaxID=6565 RepID=A0A8B8CQT7_CRAVI|nr:multiple epidermal growth factor-like domains protein 10 isoform X1 [Crassostrea virginica]
MILLWLIVFSFSAPFVFGACPAGTYGPGCANTCGFCLNNQTCDETTGSCERCSAGYQGILCKSECRSGDYGENCELRCDDLCLNGTCDPKNGTCTKIEPTTAALTTPSYTSTITVTRNAQPITQTSKRGLIFDSPVVFLVFSVPGLVLVGVGTLVLCLILALLCHSAINKCCPRKVQVEPTYHAKRRRSTRRAEGMGSEYFGVQNI